MTMVLEHFAKEGDDPNGVEAKLKTGGGVEETYRGLCGTATGNAVVGVNIERTSPLEADNGGLDSLRTERPSRRRMKPGMIDRLDGRRHRLGRRWCSRSPPTDMLTGAARCRPAYLPWSGLGQ
jgi:hypothetical protein